MDMLTIAMLFFQLAVTLGVGLVGLGDTDLLSSLIPGALRGPSFELADT